MVPLRLGVPELLLRGASRLAERLPSVGGLHAELAAGKERCSGLLWTKAGHFSPVVDPGDPFLAHGAGLGLRKVR
jgi:hypothetical protein